jgi:hypothetical protein
MPSCKAGDPAVWVTSSHKTYYMMGNPSAGKGMGGSYMCRSRATKMGAKMSGKASMMSSKMTMPMSSGSAPMSKGAAPMAASSPMSGNARTNTVPGTENGQPNRTTPNQPTMPAPNKTP